MLCEVGQLRDGGLVLMSPQHFPSPVKWVEYFIAQRLFAIVYQDPAHGSDLMEYELSDVADRVVRAAPSSGILVVDASDPNDLSGYDVPLIQVGV